tara:strand:+ start:166 stop:1095 length:930 start_codon:yes stop_codon:yes gene_type:complete
MKSAPLVSIIINCHNGEKYLHEALRSVFIQTYENWEIIFWDNSSDDGSANIAKTFELDLNKKGILRYFYSANKTSLGMARNQALKNANGKYIAFLDCDDIYYPEKIEKQVELMERNSFIMTYGSAIFIDKNGQEIRKYLVKNKSGNIFPELLRHYEINMQTVMVLHSYLIKNKMGFSESLKYCPDHNLFMNIASSNPIGVIEDFLVKYRILENSLSNKTIDIAGSEIRLTLDEIIKNSPKLKSKYERSFEQAYGKSYYYDSIADISCDDRKSARKKLKSILTLKMSYFLLYLFLFLPVPKSLILKLVGR